AGAGGTPRAIVASDFDDGRDDLAVANSASDDLGVQRSLGNGRFTPAQVKLAGNGPRAIAAGDFDGDRHAYLAVVNPFDDSVSVRLGEGGGDFEPMTNYAVGRLPTAVAVGDFNNDGRDDRAVVNANEEGVRTLDDTMSGLLDSGTGSFGPANAGSFCDEMTDIIRSRVGSGNGSTKPLRASHGRQLSRGSGLHPRRRLWPLGDG